jgi:hypothetical protein
MGYWLWAATGTLPCDIDASGSNSEVTVSLGQCLQTVPLQHGADSRRVAFGHLINAKNERKIDSLFNSKTAEQRVLGTAGSIALICPDRDRKRPLRQMPPAPRRIKGKFGSKPRWPERAFPQQPQVNDSIGRGIRFTRRSAGYTH